MDIRKLHKKPYTLLASTSLIHRAGFALAFLALGSHNAQANPEGGVVVGGSATITNNGPKVDIHQSSQRAVIDWRGFDIAVGEHTQFHQPNASAIALNRVNSSSASQINGMLTANGNVVVINPNGVVFGKNSQVDVNGIIASTADTSNADFMAGGKLQLNIAGKPDARIVNQGTITAKQAGLVGLVAPNVENSGVIRANLGKVTLASGDTATVDLYGDKLVEVAVSDAVTSQLISNSGTIEAAGGTITLTAAAGANVVNSLIEVSGELKAPAVAQRNGEIIIYAEGSNAVIGNNVADKAKKSGASTVLISGKLEATSNEGKGGKITVTADHVGVLAGARIDASGELGGGIVHVGGAWQGLGATPTALRTIIQSGALIQANALRNGHGGEVVVWADNRTDFGGQINAMGGTEEGDGGSIETSGRVALNVSGNASAISRRRGKAGEWLLDPNNIIIQAAGSDTNVSASPNFTSNNDDAIVTTASINAALNAGTSVTIMTGTGGTNLQGGDIIVADAILKNAGSGLAPTLTLSASRNIIVNASISAVNFGSINLVLQANKDNFGSGYVNINADITTRNGTLTIGGGSDMTTGFAYGNAGQAAGVRINGALDSGTGALIIRGHGFNNAGTDNNHGVLIEGAGSILSRVNTITGIGGAGANHNYGIYNNGRTLSTNAATSVYTGTGGGTGNNNYGVYLHGGLVESTATGNVTVTGTGGGLGANGSNNYGVFIDNGGNLTSAGGTGTTVTAIGGGAGTGTNNYGLHITGALSRIGTTTGVAVAINGVRGGGDAASNYGVYVDTTNGVRTTSAGNVTVKTDTLFLNTASAIIANGILNIAGYTAGTTIGVGDGATGTLQISSALFGYFGAANGVQIGDATSGDITLAGHVTTSGLSGLAINSGANILTVGAGSATAGNIALNALTSASGDITFTHDYDLNATSSASSDIALYAYNNISFGGGSDITARRHVSLVSNRDSVGTGAIYVGPGTALIAQLGNVTLAGGTTGFLAPVGNAANKYGVHLDGVSVTAGANTANALIIRGTGYADGGNGNVGIRIVDSALDVTGLGGISIVGTGGGTGASASNTGVHVGNSTISGSGGGALSITGTGGNTTGNSNHGLSIDGSNIYTTGTGTMTLSGTGRGTGTSTYSFGIQLTNASNVRAVNGLLTVGATGGGAAAGTGSDNYGLYVSGAGSVLQSTGSGGATITATGGAGTGGNQYGLLVDTGGAIRGNGGAITVTAQGGNNTAGSAQTALLVTGTGSVIRNQGTGTISITATGRGTGTTTATHGIELADGGRITTVNGDLTIVDAKGGANNTAGIDNYGMYIHGVGSSIRTTGTGDLFITATSSATASQAAGNMGLRLDSTDGIATTGGGDINVNATGRSGTAGSVGNSVGLYINGGSITGSGGAIVIAGTAGNGRTVDNTGVRLLGGGISNTGTGTVHITGTGRGNTSATSSGIEILGGGAIVADDGNVTLIGIGGGGGNGSNNHGIYISGTGSTVRTTGDGAISATGTGGLATTGTVQHGIFIEAMNGIQTTGGGAITLHGTGAPSATTSNLSSGIQVAGGSIVGSGGAMNLTGMGGIGSGGGNTGVSLSGTGAIIRNTGTGALTITGTGGGAGNAGTNRGVSVTAGGSLETDDGDLTITAFGGSGVGSGANNQGVYVSDVDSVIQTLGDGDIDITATAGQNSTGNTHVGIYVLSQGSIKALGNGDITLEGTGGGSGASTSDHGIYVLSGGSITGNGGRMELTGLGGANGIGVSVNGTDSAISNVGNGNLIIAGTGGTGTVDGNSGVSVGSAAVVSVEHGLLDVTGLGGGTGVSAANHGIRVLSGTATIRATGSGSVKLLATGGGTASSASTNHGVAVGSSTANITVNTGMLDINATGGGSSGVGLWIGSGGTVQSTGDNAGAVTIVAHGGNGGGGNNIGIQLNDGSLLTSKTGDMTVSAYGGGDGTGTNNRGITFFGLARFTSVGTSAPDAANITLNAFGGNGASYNEAIVMDGNSLANSSVLRTNIGDITVNATAGANSDAIWMDRNAQIFASNTGDLTITTIADSTHHGITSDGTGSSSIGGSAVQGDIAIIANRLDLTHVTVTTDSTGTIVLRPYVANTTVGLGNGATGSFNLDDTELANIINTGSLTIGSALSTGDVDINAWNLSSRTYHVSVHGNDIDIGGLTLGNQNFQAIARDAGGDLGRIHVSDAVTKSVAGTTTLTLTADETISFANDADITATTGALNVALLADADNDTVGLTSLGGVDIVTNGGNFNTNKAVALTGDATIDTGTGALSILGNINGGYSFTAVAKSMSFGGALGNSVRLDNVSLTSTDSLTLPAITADSIFARTTGATSDIALGSGRNLTAYDSGFAITLASARNFANNGSSMSVIGGGKWRVFSANPANNTVTGLSADFRRFSCNYGGSCPSYSVADGNGFLYSITPVLTVTPNAVTITYGAAPNLTNYHYSISGYLGSDASADVVTGALNGSTGYAQYQNIGSFTIAHQSGALTSAMGYGFTYASRAGGLTVNPKMLNITGITANSKPQDGTLAAALSGTAVLNGIENSDAVLLSGTPVGIFASPLPGSNIAVTVTGYTLAGAKAGNYTVAMPTGLSADILAGSAPPSVLVPPLVLTPPLPIKNTPSPITTSPTYHWVSNETTSGPADGKDGTVTDSVMGCNNCGPDYRASNAAVAEIIKGLVSDGLLQISSDMVIAYNEQQRRTRHS